MKRTLSQRLTAEGIGTCLLLAAIVGSGIMAERLAGGNVAVALLANTLATGLALTVLILVFGPVSGGHFNPAVTIADAAQQGLRWRDASAYVATQLLGACAGVWLAHGMFAEPLVMVSSRARSGPSQVLSEFVATFGLLAVIGACTRAHAWATPFAVGAYIAAGFWFTASTSFANPAVTVARALTDTFTGIRPADVPGFLAGQGLGAAAGTAVVRWLWSAPRGIREDVVAASIDGGEHWQP